jgi:hypothetical protein
MSRNWEVTNMNVFTEKSAMRQSDRSLLLYHKILDYHLTEIVMATLALGATFFFLHR